MTIIKFTILDLSRDNKPHD